MPKEYKLYVSYNSDGKPVAYRYGEDWCATALFVDGGYPTPEEAKEAWFEYLSQRKDRGEQS